MFYIEMASPSPQKGTQLKPTNINNAVNGERWQTATPTVCCVRPRRGAQTLPGRMSARSASQIARSLLAERLVASRVHELVELRRIAQLDLRHPAVALGS